MKEWRVHPKYTKYLVSTDGEVKNRITNNICSVYYIKGRSTVNIVDDEGNTYSKSLANIVATTFVPNPEGLLRVRHINGNKKDNRASNLEWYCKVDTTGTKAKSVVKKVKYEEFSVMDIPDSTLKSYTKADEYVTHRGKRYLVSRPVSYTNTKGVLTIKKQLTAIKMLRAGKSIEEVASVINISCRIIHLWIAKTLDPENNYKLIDYEGRSQYSIPAGAEYKRFIEENITKGSAV